MDSPNLVYEQKFGSKERFASMYDLHSRYVHVRDKTKEHREKWKNYLLAYRRTPYLRRDKGKDANFGQFRFKIDNAVDTFKGIVMNREYWANIIPLKAPDKATRTDWSRKISLCWHEEFIRPWIDGIIQTHWDVFNMQMFGAGIAHFENMGDVYPESLDTELVFPDLGSSVLVKDWEIAFVVKRMSLTELYEKSKSDDSWNEQAIKDLLDYKGGSVQDSLTDIERMRLNTTEMTDTNQSVLVVIAYVKEYTKSKKNGKVTKYIFPEDGIIAKRDNSTDKKEVRYLCKIEEYAKCISEVLCIRTFHSFKDYWAGEGLSQHIYVACMQYDQTMNRAIRASLRKAVLYLNSNNPDEQDRLRNMPADEVVVLDSDTKIQQVTVSTELVDLAATTRQLMFDTERGTGENLSSGSQNVRNRAITAEEQRANTLREGEKNTTQLDIFILQDSFLVKEMVRRSLNVSSVEPEYKSLERFKMKMAEYGIPEEAYKYENLLVESSFSLFAGSITSRLQLIDRLLGYTRIKPEHAGVENATRDGIGAIVGYDMVDYYYPYGQKPDESQTQRAGTENEILDDPELNPINAQVIAVDNHTVHVEMHLMDAENDIELAKKAVEQFELVPFAAKPIAIEKAYVRLRAVDNKLSHTEAHKQFLITDPFMEGYVKDIDKRMSRIRNIQQDVQSLHENNIESFAKDNQNQAFLTQEQQARMVKMQQDIQYEQAMNDIALGKAVNQATLRQATAQQKFDQSQQKFIQEMIQQQVRNELELNGLIKKSSIDLAVQEQQAIQQNATSKDQAGGN